MKPMPLYKDYDEKTLCKLLKVTFLNTKNYVTRTEISTKYKIDLIVTECTDMSQNKLETYTQSLDYITKTNIYRLLKNNDYKMINWVNSDLVFARKDLEI